MDLSKLPKLSQTDKHAPPPQPQQEMDLQPPPRRAESLAPAGADVWISLAVGAIILLMYPRFLQWLSSRLFGTHFNEFMLNGVAVPYPQVPAFWADLGPTLFGIVLIVEGLALALARKRMVLWGAFILTVGATALNLIYLLTTFSKYGLPLVSAFAVAFGVYIALHQWRMLQGNE